MTHASRMGGVRPALGTACAAVLLAGAVATSCGGSVRSDSDASGGAGGAGASTTGGAGGSGNTGNGGSGGTPVGGSGGSGGSDSGPDAPGGGGTGGYVEPGCPDAEAPPPQFDCDPLGPNTCAEGQACYPFVSYPSEPCDFEIYGATCSKAGYTQQGGPCGQLTPGSVSLCAPGLACFVTGQGTQCAKLCDLFGPNVCPLGLLCLTTDVEGVGACF